MKIALSLGNSHLGRHALDFLLEKGIPAGDLVAIARTPGKLDDLARRGLAVRPGTYGDEPSLIEALQGVDRVYMISGMAPPDERIRQHRGFIDAARKSGVSRVVYTSFLDTSEGSPFFAWTINQDSEAYLKDSGMDFTILRSGMYAEADLDYIGEYLKIGTVANNIGSQAKVSYISRRDLALAAVHCLLEEGHLGKTYTITGPEPVTQPELAQLISAWTGKTIPYMAMSDDDYRAIFPEPHWAEVVVTLYQSVRLGNMEVVSEDFETITGRKAYTLGEIYDRYYARSGP